jgi:hypothetical protein
MFMARPCISAGESSLALPIGVTSWLQLMLGREGARRRIRRLERLGGRNGGLLTVCSRRVAGGDSGGRQ